MNIVHSNLKPVRTTSSFRRRIANGSTQTNIVIDNDFHARLTDYGLIEIISDPNAVDHISTIPPSVGTVRYMAPELLNPSGFNLQSSNPTRRSDIYAFGVVTYRVSITHRISVVVIDGTVQVTTGELPFPEEKVDTIVDGVIAGERPSRPSDTNEWVSDNVWNLISLCWSPSWDSRPDVYFAMNALNNAADVVESRRRKSYATNSQGKKASRGGSGALYGDIYREHSLNYRHQ